jgi:N-acetylglutamate synthase-like GNAT family acetyltransferase
MQIRRADREELAEVTSILEGAGLAPLPSGFPLWNVLVGLEESRIAGIVALEVAGRQGLLRSAAVRPERTRSGLGTSLLRALLSRANELGLRDLYLLTGTAQEFFAQMGFVEIERGAAPPEIRATSQWNGGCPESARAMRLAVETRYL